MCFVYALQSLVDSHLYIGISKNVEKRLLEHNRDSVKSTKARKPFRIIFIEEALDKRAARVREKQLKSGCGREFLKKYYLPK